MTFSGKLEDVASAVNILNDAFRIYYSDQPVEDQQRAQIEAARRGDNYHTCKEGMKGGENKIIAYVLVSTDIQKTEYP